MVLHSIKVDNQIIDLLIHANNLFTPSNIVFETLMTELINQFDGTRVDTHVIKTPHYGEIRFGYQTVNDIISNANIRFYQTLNFDCSVFFTEHTTEYIKDKVKELMAVIDASNNAKYSQYMNDNGL